MTFTHTSPTPIKRTAQTTALRTPYHALGSDSNVHIPDWAQHRSVYRASGRTLYLVATDSVPAAQPDLTKLRRAGWNVAITQDPHSSVAHIALTRAELSRTAA